VTHRKPAIAFVLVTLALDVFGFGLIIPIFPKLVATFAAENVAAASFTYGMLATVYSLMQFLFAPMLGSLSDRFGRRPVILLSLLGSGLDYFLLAYAQNLTWFFVGRVIAGITGANFAAATAYIADVSPPEKRAANFGLIGAAFGIGFIAGPALGGLIGNVGLRVPFIVAGILTLLNWLYGCFVLPESLAPTNRRKFTWGRSNPVGSLLHLRKYPMAMGLAGAHVLIHLAHQVLPSTWVLYTGYRYNWTVGQTGISLAIVGLTSVLVQVVLTPIIVRRLGESKTAVLGLGISALSYAGYGLAPYGWIIYVILAIGSLAGVTGPAILALISRTVGADEQGSVQGSLASLASVAAIIGIPTATALFGYFIREDAPIHLPGAAFFFSALLTVCAMLVAIRAVRQIIVSPNCSSTLSSSAAPDSLPQH
jgi:MFS transporter, DHA1 family, tetracycline resistance protein